MIKVEVETKDYWKCNACHSEVDLKKISISSNANQTSSFRLCNKCRKEMREQLVEVIRDD